MLSWKFIPSPAQTALFNKTIVSCGLDPEKVALRYAYADDGIAITLFNTIVIDPMLWKDVDDPEFYKTREIIEKFVLPSVDEDKKRLHANIDTILTPTVQEFIFKHELGHIVRQFSIRRIILVGIIAFVSTSVALLTVRAAIHLGGFTAFCIGFLVGTCVDLILSYASNVFFKAQEEKRADFFACSFSSREQIEHAADFFEQYEHFAQMYRETLGGIHILIPTILLSGYINGKSRSQYLKANAHAKKETI